ncbi:DUF881 domain-containing protein [Nocardioides sp. GXQ0305]|uniref:DUF881 domain-containing protein n=1 Tax=Nocardioides sp. GXQ0305 TaxID=3423912 RepID=UPI003D7D590C
MPDPTPPPDAADAPSGRKRLLDALRRPSRRQAVVGVLLAVFGFAFVTQVTSFGVTDTYSGYRQQALIDVLDGLAGTTRRTEAEIARLEETREDLRNNTSAEEAALEEARRETEDLQILAGVVPVTGPGIRVTITEESGQVDIDSLLDTVQEMRTAFAEAMQFNGRVRVVAQTSFEDATGGVYVDGTLLEPPYVLDVIGDPHTLHGGLTFPEGPIDQLNADGAEVEVEELDSLDIESTVEPERLEFAQPEAP